MKIFGFEIGNSKYESIEDQIEKQISTLKRMSPGLTHKKVYNELNNLCLNNPNAVASLIFCDKLDEETKYKLLFEYSKDHGGSCWLRDNPRWANMMRSLVVPRLSELPEELRHTVEWYQRVHGL